jgi:hypothetical protein
MGGRVGRRRVARPLADWGLLQSSARAGYCPPGRLKAGLVISPFTSDLTAEGVSAAAIRVSILSRLSWKWRARFTVKITERTREEITKALHPGREGCHPAAAFTGTGADLQAL